MVMSRKSSRHSLASSSRVITSGVTGVQFSGWLHKWTNYIHGYQKRYFQLKNGHLHYFRSESQNASCRGRLKLDNATFHIQSPTMFVVSNNQQCFTLRANNEIDR